MLVRRRDELLILPASSDVYFVLVWVEVIEALIYRSDERKIISYVDFYWLPIGNVSHHRTGWPRERGEYLRTQIASHASFGAV
jgi:hypothetical protein